MFLQLLANGVAVGCTYALVALGLGLVYNTTGIFHIAHGAVYTASAYAFYSFSRGLGLETAPSFLLGVGFGMLLGIGVEAVLYWPFYRRRASLTVVFIASLGVYILLVNLVAMLYGNETKILGCHSLE